MVKEYLSQKGVAFQEFDVSKDYAAAQEMVNRTGQQGVPVIIIEGQIVIGFNRPEIDRLLAGTSKPTFGAFVADAARITGGTAEGAYVGKVKPGSLAAGIGLMHGDIIISIDMQPITDTGDLAAIISQIPPGRRFSLTYVRDNRPVTVEGSF